MADEFHRLMTVDDGMHPPLGFSQVRGAAGEGSGAATLEADRTDAAVWLMPGSGGVWSDRSLLRVDTSAWSAFSALNMTLGIGTIRTNVLVQGAGAFRVSQLTTAQRGNLLSVDNGMLIYNTDDSELQARIAGAWVALGAGGGGATDLDDLTDVVIAAPATGELLRYNGANWVNAVLQGTTSVLFEVNSDAAAGVAENPEYILSGGDGGTDLVTTAISQDSVNEVVTISTLRNGADIPQTFAIGTATGLTSRGAEFRMRGATGTNLQRMRLGMGAAGGAIAIGLEEDNAGGGVFAPVSTALSLGRPSGAASVVSRSTTISAYSADGATEYVHSLALSTAGVLTWTIPGNRLHIGSGGGPVGSATILIAPNLTGASAGQGSDCVYIGNNIAGGNGSDTVVIGSDITGASGSQRTGIGHNVNVTGAGGTAVGWVAEASGSTATALGYNARAAHNFSVAIGRQSVTSAASQIMMGGSSTNFTDFCVGGGNVSTAPSTITFRPSDGSSASGWSMIVRAGNGGGTNQAGGRLSLRGGTPTGSGAEGDLLFQSGSQVNGQGLRYYSQTELLDLTALGAVSADTAITFDAPSFSNGGLSAFVLGVTAYVETAVNTDWRIGASSGAWYVQSISSALGTRVGRNTPFGESTAGVAVRVRSEDGVTNLTTGRIRITIHYLMVEPPTS